MGSRPRSICLVAGRLSTKTQPLQPWRYLLEVGKQLAAHGHRVSLLSDGSGGAQDEGRLEGLPIRWLPSVSRPRWRGNPALDRALADAKPDVILLHFGTTSVLHQRLDGWPAPTVGIFSSIMYKPQEIRRLGLRNLYLARCLLGIHLLGLAVPRKLLKSAVRSGRLAMIVSETETTRQRLIAAGVPGDHVKTIGPGVGPEWLGNSSQERRTATRHSLGYGDSDLVVAYFGAPEPMRGLYDLVRAITVARDKDLRYRLLVLSRCRDGELLRERAAFERVLEQTGARDHTQVVSDFMSQETLASHIMAADVVALPFQLMPTDAPLTVLEAQALGKPVVTTCVACLPELARGGVGYIAEPANPSSLADALWQARDGLQARSHHPAEEADAPRTRSWSQVGEEWCRLVEGL